MFPVMLALWVVQRTYQNAVIADLGFCLGFGAIVLWYAMVADGNPFRRWLVGSMGAVYASRLGLYLFLNRIFKTKEDARYQRLRSQWGNQSQLYFFLYFQGQAIAVAVFSPPLLVLMHNPEPTIQFLGNRWDPSVGDCRRGGKPWLTAQLTRFRGQAMNRGKNLS